MLNRTYASNECHYSDALQPSWLYADAEEPLNDRSPQGILVDHHQGTDGSDYVRFVFGKRPRGAEDWKMDEALDAEFLFLAGMSQWHSLP